MPPSLEGKRTLRPSHSSSTEGHEPPLSETHRHESNTLIYECQTIAHSMSHCLSPSQCDHAHTHRTINTQREMQRSSACSSQHTQRQTSSTAYTEKHEAATTNATSDTAK